MTHPGGFSLSLMEEPKAEHIAFSENHREPACAQEHADLVNPYAAILGANVERLRKGGKITKTRFAAMLGIGRPLLNKIEEGTANPRLGLICDMAGALDVSPGELLEPPAPEPMRLTPRGHLIPDDGYQPPRH